jgi:hypothetical protein
MVVSARRCRLLLKKMFRPQRSAARPLYLFSIEVADVGQASRLTSEIKRPQARRPRYIPEAKINRLFA